MKFSLVLPLVGLSLVAHVAATPTTLAKELAPEAIDILDQLELDDGEYYPDANSDTPWNGTIIEDDGSDPDWDFVDDDLEDWSDEEAGSTLVKRHPNYFTFYRRHWFYRNCLNGNCVDYELDTTEIHNDCNGGNCNGDTWRENDWNQNLCDKSFKSCGKTYVMGYTGKEWSCARMMHFVREGAHHGRTYANLMSGGRKVGTCKVFNKKRFGKSCDIWAASSFWAQIQCQIF